MTPDILTALTGGIVGIILGLVGGGGSIIAVPLLLYVVGMASVHQAVGTSAVAVSLSALGNLLAKSSSLACHFHCQIIEHRILWFGSFL